MMAMPDSGFQGLIVGLGNPGSKYRHTPHNFGFLILEALLASPVGYWSGQTCPVAQCELFRGTLNGMRWLAATPMTYMNLSGEALGPLARWYKFRPDQILVIHDELDLPFGALRFKRGGGAAGHKGILSITSALGSNAYYRLRAGIGRPPPGQDCATYVLQRFTLEQESVVDRILGDAVQAVHDYCRLGPQSAMQSLHTVSGEPAAKPLLPPGSDCNQGK